MITLQSGICTQGVFYVVLRREVEAITAEGDVVASWASGVDIGTAAWDGERLVVADEMAVRVLDAELSVVAEGAVMAPCFDALLVPGPFFVCKNDGPEPRFFVYDAVTAEPVSQSEVFSFVGRRMHGVPGTSDFFTVATPDVDMTLFRVSPTGEVGWRGESAFGVAGSMSDVLVVEDHAGGSVIGHKGRRYVIAGPDCDPALGSQATCFVEEGGYALPGEGFHYQAMHRTAEGMLFGLTNRAEGEYQACGNGGACPVCPNGCRIHQAVLDEAQVVAEAETGEGVMSPGAFVLPDGTGEGVVLGYDRVPEASGELSPGHRVVRVPLGAPGE